LASLGCPLGQGFWFAAPVPAKKLAEILSAGTPGDDVSKPVRLVHPGCFSKPHRLQADG
jgi:hypothetical protein